MDSQQKLRIDSSDIKRILDMLDARKVHGWRPASHRGTYRVPAAERPSAAERRQHGARSASLSAGWNSFL